MRKQELLFGGEERKAEKKEPLEAAKPLSVSAFIALVNERLRELEAQITGEVTKASFPPSGHVYFSLKDEHDGSVIDCVIWRSPYEAAGIKLEAGLRIVALGHADVYPPTGRLAFKARAIELTGEGILKKRYEELKRKLAAEGVFDEARKRTVPDYPERIGIITSRNGAVIHDLLNNFGPFGFKVLFADARVEGPEAVGSIMEAFKLLSRQTLDVVIVARGGGSMEALQAFDNEKLVRAISDFPVPVIAAIGHHEDVPLAALAADAHPSTPTAAAQFVNRSWQEASFRVAHESERIFRIYRNIVAGARGALDPAAYLRSAQRIYGGVLSSIDAWAVEIPELFKRVMARAEAKIDVIQRVVAANDPARNLRLGYSIARRDGKVLKSVRGVRTGDHFDLQLKDGIIEARAERKKQVGE